MDSDILVDMTSDYMCNIEAKFWRTISWKERLQRAERVIGNTDPVIETIIKRNENVFMAELIKHH